MVLGFLFGLGLLGILNLAAIIWAVIDIAVNQKKETGWKIIWLVICILLEIIGVIVYYFASGRKVKKK
jgi:hypothetical protein